MADHLGLVASGYTCHLRNGLAFEVRGGTDDRHVLFEVFVERVYPIDVTPGGVVVDIGANIGAFTALAARAGARVLSCEPCPDNLAILERNVRRNGLDDVQVVAAAIGRERGRRPLFIPDDRSWTGRYSLHPGRGARTLDVECVSLADVLAENALDRVDLLKIDCEGGEYEILFAADDEALSRIRAIAVECHHVPGSPRAWSPAGLSAFLAGRGFTVTCPHGRILDARR